MLNLRATNNQLTINAKYSFLSENYSSGISSFDIDSIIGFSIGDYLILGNFGNETAEIVQIHAATAPAGNTITLAAGTTTSFAHPESTKVTIIPFNQVKYYHTTTATFADTDVLATIDVQADSLFTIYSDSANQSGFGFFKFFNSITAVVVKQYSMASNAIPYANFNDNSVKKILDGFYSILNAKEKKIITSADSFRYLNEAYSLAISELNLVNNEYTTSDSTDIAVVSGTKEYALKDIGDNFSDVISVYSSTDKFTIDPIKLEDVAANDISSSNEVKYYIRGDYIGFSPTPTASFTAKIRFKENSAEVTSLYDNITLPDNSHMILVDFMLYRAYLKLQNPKAIEFYKIFFASIDRMKMTSFKRTNSKDQFSIAIEANV